MPFDFNDSGQCLLILKKSRAIAIDTMQRT